eukprot:PhM_4_TR11189/c0_g1_i1/m.13803
MANRRYADESVYDLIPTVQPEAQKPPLYRSKHDPTLLPSYSTLGLKNTNKLIRNTDGALKEQQVSTGLAGASHTMRKPQSTMGAPLGNTAADPKKFLKRATGQPHLEPIPHQFSRTAPLPRKPEVPHKDERPIMGLRSDKNYVVANSVENIVSVPKKKAVEPIRAVDRGDYGKVPGYLTKVKTALQQEKEYIEQANAMHDDSQYLPQYMREVDPAEKRDMIDALKAKLEEKQRVYYALPFSKDTATQITRKEKLEKDMAAIESALQKLDKDVVMVYSDMSKYYAMHARAETLREAQKMATRRHLQPQS